MEILTIINPHRKSNTYVLKVSPREIVLIDVGDFDTKCLLDWMELNNLNLKAVILTHEHSDHCLGVNQLSQLFEFELYCSEMCAANIRDPKQNFSKYLEGVVTFSILKECSILKDNSVIRIGKEEFQILETPGHSPGSICILSGNAMFSGDTLMESNTPLSFPHSDRESYRKSLKKLQPWLEQNVTIYPGHGKQFSYKESEVYNALSKNQENKSELN